MRAAFQQQDQQLQRQHGLPCTWLTEDNQPAWRQRLVVIQHRGKIAFAGTANLTEPAAALHEPNVHRLMPWLTRAN